jgi:hypothetical protein
MENVTRDPSSISNWICLLLFPLCILHRLPPYAFPRSISRSQFQIRNIFHALGFWSKGINGIIHLIDHLATCFSTYHDSSTPPSSISVCKAKVASGQYRSALNILKRDGLAPNDDSTFSILASLHPQRDIPNPIPLSDTLFPENSCSSVQILKAIHSFPKDTAPGCDGLRPRFLLDFCRGSASSLSDRLFTNIHKIVLHLLRGTCPSLLAPFISSAPLIAVRKKQGGIRPIAVGLVWRRICSKVALSFCLPHARDYLGDHQFGVGFPGGCEAIIHSTNRFVASHQNSPNLTLATLDFSNAFNTIERSLVFDIVSKEFPYLSSWISFSYGCKGSLYFNKQVLFSTAGIQQGDPLGPLLFSLGLHSIVGQLRTSCSLSFMAWYLDDGTIIGPAYEVSKAISLIASASLTSGLRLNFNKSELYWPSFCDLWNDSSLFHKDMIRNLEGVCLLGSTCSILPSYIASKFSLRVDKALTLLENLSSLGDPHSELLLLRSCLGTPKLVYFLRTSSPCHISSEIAAFDTGIRNKFSDIIGFGGHGLTNSHWNVIGLPCRYGGLGILHAKDLSSFSFVFSLHSTESLQSHILSYSQMHMPPHLDFTLAFRLFHDALPDYLFHETNSTSPFDAYYQSLTDRLKTEVSSLPRLSLILSLSKRQHASSVWFTLPIPGLGWTIEPFGYRLALRYRLGLPVYPVVRQCGRCRLYDIDIFGDHAIHCASRPGYKLRHDQVCSSLFSLFKEACIPVVKEAEVSFLTTHLNVDRGFRPADILIPSWSEGKPACVDVTIVSPMVISGQSVLGEIALSRAVERKKQKYANLCQENGYTFIPFACDTFGGLSNDSLSLLIKLQRSLSQSSQDREDVIVNYVYRKIGFAIFKGLAQQLAARWPD